MKRLACLILAALCAAALAMEASMTPEEKEHCAQEGGCLFTTVAAVNQRIRAAFDAGVKHGAVVCRSGA